MSSEVLTNMGEPVTIWTQLYSILDFLWDTLDQVVVLYFTAGSILSIVFAIWIIKKVARLFEIIIK